MDKIPAVSILASRPNDENVARQIGAWAKEARKSVELSIEDMATILDLSVSQLYKIEGGFRTPHLSTILQIAAATGNSPARTLATIVDEYMETHSTDDIDYERG